MRARKGGSDGFIIELRIIEEGLEEEEIEVSTS